MTTRILEVRQGILNKNDLLARDLAHRVRGIAIRNIMKYPCILPKMSYELHFNPVYGQKRAQVAMPVVQNTCHYRKWVKFGMPLVLYTTHHLQLVYEGRLVFNHYLMHEKAKTAMAFGQTVTTLVDMRSQRLVKEWPEKVWQRYQALA